ncbi:hypothetical protein EDC01DRAFT_629003 [Geopyxis carbonaria]|nr:hypothetical protein EDC01DRAFT_629003 [Geopyxis carbonaria]
MNVTTRAAAVPAIDAVPAIGAEHAAATIAAVPTIEDDVDGSSPSPAIASHPRRAPGPAPISSFVADHLETRGPGHGDDHFSTDTGLEVPCRYGYRHSVLVTLGSLPDPDAYDLQQTFYWHAYREDPSELWSFDTFRRDFADRLQLRWWNWEISRVAVSTGKRGEPEFLVPELKEICSQNDWFEVVMRTGLGRTLSAVIHIMLMVEPEVAEDEDVDMNNDLKDEIDESLYWNPDKGVTHGRASGLSAERRDAGR